MRRAPVQERSTVRVQRMLDACGELIDELGYEAITTTLIARRAGVSVGSLYQFFPDKRAVVQALARRNMESFMGRLEEILLARQRADWRKALHAAFDLFVELHRVIPGFRVVRFGDIVDTHLLEPEQDNDYVFVGRMVGLLATYFEQAPDKDLRAALVVLVKALDAVTRYAFREREGDAAVLAEARILMDVYLAHHLRTRGLTPTW
ncbi:MAG TPA: TetR/AcrR family transcriptional regulator [Mycobacteriales bacterium]|nr:TetR/AcrR family transcriptional regulator [Mycobacteriales bacterium]